MRRHVFLALLIAAGEASAQLGPGASVLDNRITISAENGKRVTFESKADVVRFDYRRYLPDVRLHVVYGLSKSGDAFILVSQSDGARFNVPAEPHLSPDGKMLLAASAKESDDTAGVYLYRIAPGMLTPALIHKPEQYALYEFLKWNGDGSASLSRVTNARGACKGPHMSIGVTLREESGRWRLQDDPTTVQCK